MGSPAQKPRGPGMRLEEWISLSLHSQALITIIFNLL